MPSIFDTLSSFFNPDKAYGQAQRAEDAGYDRARGYEQPYYQHGLDQYGNLSNAENQLLDPEQLLGKWSAGYETSPFAKRELDFNKNSGLDAASSMGLMGSSAALQNIQQGAGDIMAKDRREYLNDLMQKYMTGIGLGNQLYGTGANAAAQLSNMSAQQAQDNAGLAYGKAAAPGELLGKEIGMGVNYFAPGVGSRLSGGMPQTGGNMYNPAIGGY